MMMSRIEDGRFSTPSLTTISPDKAQIANLVVDLLLSRIKGGNAKPPREVQADFTLVVRESSAGQVVSDRRVAAGDLLAGLDEGPDGKADKRQVDRAQAAL